LKQFTANQTRPECNIPVGCTPVLNAVDPNTCYDNGNIETECNEATTHVQPTGILHSGLVWFAVNC
jgi:hypothetical protein